MIYIKNKSELTDVLNFLRINPLTTIVTLKEHLENHILQLGDKLSQLQERLLYMKKVRDKIIVNAETRKSLTVKSVYDQNNPNLLRYQEIAKNASVFKKFLDNEVAYIPSDLVSVATRSNMNTADRIMFKIGNMTRVAINASSKANDIGRALDMEQSQIERLIKLQANEIISILSEKQQVMSVLYISDGSLELVASAGSMNMTLPYTLEQSQDYLMRVLGI